MNDVIIIVPTLNEKDNINILLEKLEEELVLTLISNENDDIRYEADFGISLLVEQDNQMIPGDVNGDATVNILDIVMVANYTIGQADFTDEQIQVADLNQDGNINILDIVQIINIVLEP